MDTVIELVEVEFTETVIDIIMVPDGEETYTVTVEVEEDIVEEVPIFEIV